jgi:hypothetical protein
MEDCTKLDLLHDEAELLDLMSANPKLRKEKMSCCRLGPLEVRISRGHYWYALRESHSRPTQIKPPVNAILQARNHTTNAVGFKFGPLTLNIPRGVP